MRYLPLVLLFVLPSTGAVVRHGAKVQIAPVIPGIGILHKTWDVLTFYDRVLVRMPEPLRYSDITPFLAPARHFSAPDKWAHAELPEGRICFNKDTIFGLTELEVLKVIKHELLHHYMSRNKLPSGDETVQFKAMAKLLECE
jgi:hypothetical protein